MDFGVPNSRVNSKGKTEYEFENQFLTLTQIKKQYFTGCSRSTPWIKKGLMDGAKTVYGLVLAGDKRVALGEVKSKSFVPTSVWRKTPPFIKPGFVTPN